MSVKSIGLVGIGAAVGVVFSAYLFRSPDLAGPASTFPADKSPAEALVPPSSRKVEVVAVSMSEPATTSENSSTADGNDPTSQPPLLPKAELPFPFPTTPEQVHANMKDMERRALLRSGFPEARIQWIAQRSAELQEIRQRQAKERRPGQPPDHELRIALLDRDMDLLDEIGEVEFDRFRQALGRSTSVPITSVAAGSAAESGGLLPNDEVISYGGARTYSLHQLSELAAAEKPGTPVSVQVRRNGQTIVLSMQAGTLDVKGESPGAQDMRQLEALLGVKFAGK